MTIYTDGIRVRQGQTLEDFQSGLGEYLGAKVGQAFDDSATTSVYKMAELSGALYGPPTIDTDAMGGVTSVTFDQGPDSAQVAKADALKRIKDAGLDGHLAVPDAGLPSRALDILIERKHDELRRAAVIARAPNRYAWAGVPAAIGTQLLDPINLGAMFIPAVGEARFAGMLGRQGGRLAAGTINGLVGSAAVEPFTYLAHTQEQADYTAADSLMNIAFGGVLGGGLHVGIGAVADRLARAVPRGTDPVETISIQTPEREAFRAGVVADHLTGTTAVEGRAPIAYVMGGGGGAGKGTILGHLQESGLVPRDGVVHIDPDEIKGLIPEYADLLKAGDRRAAALVHEESSAISKRVLQAATEGRRDLVLDRTLSKRSSGLADIQRLVDAGYDVRLVGVTVDVEKAVQRAAARAARTGRHVPEADLRAAHAGFASNFEEYAGMAHEAQLFDNSGDSPLLLASKSKGGGLEIRNAEYYNKFRERGAQSERLGQESRGDADGAGRARTDAGSDQASGAEGKGAARSAREPGAGTAGQDSAGRVAGFVSWVTRESALRTAVAQLAEGRSPEVDALVRMDPAAPGERATLTDVSNAAARAQSPEGAAFTAPAEPHEPPPKAGTTADQTADVEKEAADAAKALRQTVAGIQAQHAAAEAEEAARGLPDDVKAELAEYDALVADADTYGKALRAAAACEMRS